MAPPDPPGSSPPNTDPQDLGELPESPSPEPELPTSPPSARFPPGSQFAFDLTTNPISSDELAAPFSQLNSARAARPIPIPKALKRGPRTRALGSNTAKE